MYLNYKIQKYIYVFCILQNTLQNTCTQFRNSTEFFSNNMIQTLARLMFNKFKQDYFDVKATASRMIHLTVHFHEESLSVLRH